MRIDAGGVTEIVGDGGAFSGIVRVCDVSVLSPLGTSRCVVGTDGFVPTRPSAGSCATVKASGCLVSSFLVASFMDAERIRPGEWLSTFPSLGPSAEVTITLPPYSDGTVDIGSRSS